MKNNHLRGLREVFLFTLRETFKDKRYRTSFITFVIMMTLMPVIMLISGNAGMNAAETSFIDEVTPENLDTEQLYICNLTEVEFGPADLPKDDEFLPFIETSFRDASEKDALLEGLTEKDLLVLIELSESGLLPTYDVCTITADESEISSSEQHTLGSHVSAAFDEARLGGMNLSTSAISGMQRGVSIASPVTEERFRAGDEGVTNMDMMGVSILYAVIVLVIVSVTVSFIITSLVEEKSTKLVDMLLSCVDPAALVMGKIFAMMAYVLSMIALGGSGALIASSIMRKVTGSEASAEIFSIFDLHMFMNLRSILAILVSVVLTYLIFAVMAGIAGSACATVEDSQSSTGTVMMISMAGYMIAMFVPSITNHTAHVVCSLIPMISVYIAPALYAAGKISLIVFLLFLVINGAFLVLLVTICARTYRRLAMNDSGKVPFREILRIAFPKLGAGKEAQHV